MPSSSIDRSKNLLEIQVKVQTMTLFSTGSCAAQWLARASGQLAFFGGKWATLINGRSEAKAVPFPAAISLQQRQRTARQKRNIIFELVTFEGYWKQRMSTCDLCGSRKMEAAMLRN